MWRFQQTKHALGSTAYITLVLADDTPPDPVFAELWEYIAAFEQRFSRFLLGSELTHFNQAAGSKTPISIAFSGLLGAAKSMTQKTSGVYNPFILPALQRAGYKGSWPHPQAFDQQLNYEKRSAAKGNDIQIGPDWAKIPRGTALDFGGIGKGYLLDLLADLLQDKNITNYWLSLGGDILCAGLDGPGTPWSVAIQHAVDQTRTIANVSNDGHKLAIATSGITKRKGSTTNGQWHHLIDPRTNLPADTNILTATVCADTAAAADVYAKCIVILGSDGTAEFMQRAGQDNTLLQTQSADRSVHIQKIGTIWSA